MLLFFQLNDIGLELTFAFNALLAPELVKVITDSKEQIIEAVKLRAGVSASQSLTL